MKKIGFTLLSLLILSPGLRAQKCLGIEMKQGGGFEMQSYDGKGKKNGYMIYKIKEVSTDGPDVVVKMDFEYLDKKGEPQMTNTFDMRCNGSELRVDATSMMPQTQNKQMGSVDMEITSKEMLVYPGNLSVGQTLPDASMHGEGAAGPITMVFDTEFANRKVEAKEKVTVPAGTFDTYKVTSDMSVSLKSVMNMTYDYETVSYRSEGVLWDVKSETYRKGKLIGYTELSKVL